MRGWIQRAITTVLLVASVGLATPARANATGELGRGAAIVVANVFYMPAKLLYALAGGVVAGCAYALSAGDSDVVNPIVDRSFRGDYVLIGDHLAGRREIEFIGRSVAERHARQSSRNDGIETEEPGDAGF